MNILIYLKISSVKQQGMTVKAKVRNGKSIQCLVRGRKSEWAGHGQTGRENTRQKKHPSLRPESAVNPVTECVQPLNPDHAPFNPIPNSRAGRRDIWKP